MKQSLIFLLSLLVYSCNLTTKNQISSDEIPEFLMEEYPFLLGSQTFDSYDDFNHKMKSHYMHFGQNIDKTIFKRPRIRIEYLYSLDGRTAQKESFFLDADNKESFTVGELIYKINRETVHNLKDNDHVYFEGLEYVSTNKDIPLYRIAQGS